MNTIDGAWEVFKSVKYENFKSLEFGGPLEGTKPCPVCKKGTVTYNIQHPESILRGHFWVYCSTPNCISYVK